MSNSKVLFILTGSIACYKACQAISRLTQKGLTVQVVATTSALKFVGAPTLEGLSGRPVASDLWEEGRMMDHIHLARWADVIMVAPATADYINRAAAGLATDLASSIFMAHDFKKPFLLAPAMNTAMYNHPTTQQSIQRLKEMGVHLLESGVGNLACGETGEGRLLEPHLLQLKIEEFLAEENEDPARTYQNLEQKGIEAKETSADSANSFSRNARHSYKQHLIISSQHQFRARVLVTSGGTQEPIDDVRVLTNKSTGRTGAMIAERLHQDGFEVHLLRAESAMATNRAIAQSTYVTFHDLEQGLRAQLGSHHYHAVVHAAAVSDFSLAKPATSGKLSSDDNLTLHFKKNPKLLNQLRSWSRNPDLRVIAFKMTAQADDVAIEDAVTKLFTESGAAFVVQNDTRDIDWKLNTHIYHWREPNQNSKSLASTQDLAAQISSSLGGIL